MPDIMYLGIDPAAYARVLENGVDHGGNPIEPYLDAAGGLPMRCCLADSVVGDLVAVVAWSPFPWQGAYRETGPIFIHAAGCPGQPPTDHLPREFEARNITLRPYGPDRAIDYDRVRHLSPGDGLTESIAELLDDQTDFVHGRNQTGGCYAFTARRVGSRDVQEDRRG